MPRKAELKKPSLNNFADSLWDALEHYHDPIWLGQTSPLAQTYFLGQDLLEMSGDDISPQQRGEALIKLIDRAYQTLNKQKVDVRLLEACFIAPQMGKEEDDAGEPKVKPIGLDERLEKVKIPRSSFYNKLSKTELPQRVEQLAEVILQQRRTALRLEQLPSPPLSPLYERTEVVQWCRDLLVNDNAAVGLIGASGLGKTVLGQYLAQTYFEGRVFWFTFRPHLNDHLLEVLFNLGHFCQLYLQQLNIGQNSALLATLIGSIQAKNGDRLLQETILNAWRADLKLMSTPPLLCFDEVDILHYETAQHEPLLQFLQSLLTDPMPLLLMGQELPFIVPNSYPLEPLAADDGLVELLKYHRLVLTSIEQKRLYKITRGNPRWLELWVVFYQLGGKLTDFDSHLPYQALLERINQRLTKADLDLLYELAVFRQAAPASYWVDQVDLLTRLEKLQLLERDSLDGVQVRAHWRDYFIKQLKQIDPDLLQLCHEKAAEVCTKQGQFTAALFHYSQAKKYQLAIDCWYEHRQKEIEQGQGEQALALLEVLSKNEDDLTKIDRLKLTELLVELYKLRGLYSQALATLARTTQRDKSLTEAHLRRLEGDILELRGDKRAGQAYQAGLNTVELLTEKALFHKNIAWIHRLAKGEDKAWAHKAESEIKKAQCEVYNVWGHIKMQDGQPNEALIFFQQLFDLAQQLNYQEGVAKAQNGLGAVLMDRPEVAQEAENYLQQALTFYQKIGRQTYLANIHTNLTLLYGNKLNQPLKALTHGEEALSAYQKLDEPLGIAQAAQNLAEAYLKLRQLAEAKQYATLALQQEMGEVIPDALRTLGEIALQEEQFSEAETNLHASLKLCLQANDTYLAGYAWRAFMRLYHATHQPEPLQNAYNEAVVMFTACHDSAEVADTQRLWQQFQAED